MDAAEALAKNPVVWHGAFILKNHDIPIELHFLSGNTDFPTQCLSFGPADKRFLEVQLLHKIKELNFVFLNNKLKDNEEHCVLIGIPDEKYTVMNKYVKAQHLSSYFLGYLRAKKSIGIIQFQDEDINNIYVFPNCDYTNRVLSRIVPEKMACLEDAAYVLFIIIKNR
ncbi:hypothetical protein TNIN_409121 [Trichonephila inaurata madagascariensis]|uniref:SPOC domain-containing protein n=1 Tax=Trichonephila inaurata madagascariensis TaxID=2747483 RepID=A0A8X7CRP8_9ARAC|nr:hypothetical protein TNIN_409121 [Trichonephila inaurata madagascariensis]